MLRSTHLIFGPLPIGDILEAFVAILIDQFINRPSPNFLLKFACNASGVSVSLMFLVISQQLFP